MLGRPTMLDDLSFVQSTALAAQCINAQIINFNYFKPLSTLQKPSKLLNALHSLVVL